MEVANRKQNKNDDESNDKIYCKDTPDELVYRDSSTFLKV